jgi:hypothetical protein
MRRSSPYHGLKWLVEAKWPSNAFFEVIAGFNHDRVAKSYADECMAGAPPINGKPWSYRVRERDGRGKWTVIHEAGQHRIKQKLEGE